MELVRLSSTVALERTSNVVDGSAYRHIELGKKRSCGLISLINWPRGHGFHQENGLKKLRLDKVLNYLKYP